MKRAIKLIKNRSDIGAGTRGSDMGVDAIEIAAINKGNDYFNKFPFEDLVTHNETIYQKDRNTFAKRIEKFYEQCTRVAESVCRNLQAGYLPLVFSGDHSSALGTISGIKAAFPNLQLGVIWFDAHADLHSPYTSPSGNVHGMPLAAALGYDNRDASINPVDGDTLHFWDQMKAIGTDKPKLEAQHLIYFGVRDTEEAEDIAIASLGIKNYSVSEARLRGLDVCVKESLKRLTGCDLLYISLDVDSLDCDLVSDGTGTPVGKGFDQFEIIKLINGIIKSGKVIGLEIAEVNPLLDSHGNSMAEISFDILNAITATIIEQAQVFA